MPNYILGADLSRYQGDVDFDKLIDDGVKYVIIKATQGMATDPKFDRNRAEAAKRSLLAFAYPFLTPADDVATVRNFLDVTDDMIPALDWEQAGTTSVQVARWMDGCEAARLRPGLAYYGLWSPQPVTPRIARWPRWFPQYPGTDTAPPRLPLWDATKPVPVDWSKTALIWQYTGAGRLPGITTAIDLNRLACPLEALQAWHATGTFGVSSAPTASPQATAGEIDGDGPAFGSRILHLHTTGPDVGELQTRLGIAADDVFGSLETLPAVQRYQTDHGLDPDGIVGKLTFAAMGAQPAF